MSIFTAIDRDIDLAFRMIRECDPDQREQYSENTILHAAVRRDSYELVEAILELYPQLLNTKNKKGYTPLRLATFVDSPDVVMLLMDWGADPNIADNKGRTPVFYATEQTIPFLIHSDLMFTDNDGNTPVHNVKCPIVCRRLIQSGRVNLTKVNSYNDTPLHRAVYYKHLPIVELIAPRGCGMKDDHKQTPLELACQMRSVGIAMCLIEKGAPITNAAVHRAVYRRLDPCVLKAMIDAGVKFTTQQRKQLKKNRMDSVLTYLSRHELIS